MLYAAAGEVIKEMSKTNTHRKLTEIISSCNMQIRQTQRILRHRKYFTLLFLTLDSRSQVLGDASYIFYLSFYNFLGVCLALNMKKMGKKTFGAANLKEHLQYS
jgi:hypothetical protein